jgi:tetratricopeptide (TPR) repeat protein
MFDFGLPSSRAPDIAVISATFVGTFYVSVLFLILVMPPLRMALVSVRIGSGKLLLVLPGRRVTLEVRAVPGNLGVFGLHRDARSLRSRVWIFRVAQLLALLESGLLASALLPSGGRFQRDVFSGTVLAACFLLASRTRDKRLFIAGLFKPRLKADPQVLARVLAVRYAETRFGQGDDRPMRALAAEQDGESMVNARIAYMEGRFADALAILDRQLSLLAGQNPDAAAKSRAEQAVHLAELALYAAEARQIPVSEAVPRAKASLAGQPVPLSLQALIAVLSGDPRTALPLARKARRQPGSRVDLADIHCTLAHVHGILGDRAAADESVERARALAPRYVRPDHVARRLDSTGSQRSVLRR